MDRIEIDSKVIEGHQVVIWQAADYKEVTVDKNSVFVSSALIPSFEKDFIKLTDRTGEYSGLVVIPGITGAMNTERQAGWKDGFDRAKNICLEVMKGGDVKAAV